MYNSSAADLETGLNPSCYFHLQFGSFLRLILSLISSFLLLFVCPPSLSYSLYFLSAVKPKIYFFDHGTFYKFKILFLRLFAHPFFSQTCSLIHSCFSIIIFLSFFPCSLSWTWFHSDKTSLLEMNEKTECCNNIPLNATEDNFIIYV